MSDIHTNLERIMDKCIYTVSLSRRIAYVQRLLVELTQNHIVLQTYPALGSVLRAKVREFRAQGVDPTLVNKLSSVWFECHLCTYPLQKPVVRNHGYMDQFCARTCATNEWHCRQHRTAIEYLRRLLARVIPTSDLQYLCLSFLYYSTENKRTCLR